MDTNVSSYEEVENGLSSLDSLDSSDFEDSFTSQFQTNFKPLKILGQGGFGCVFEAEKHVMGKLTLWRGAVKRIPMKKGEHEVGAALKEVEALLKFDHEGIVKFYDAWAEQPPEGWQRSSDARMLESLNSFESFTYDSAFLYIQMELCESTLAEWLSANKERDLNTIKDWFRQIVSAVAYIHKMNYIHRDLKPSNILFSRQTNTYRGEKILKVCDLGIVTDRAISSEDKGQEVPAERTFAKGTKMYMAPEQMGWADYTSKVDIFALGLILAEMLVVMTAERAGEIFNNYRCGRPNFILADLPEAEAFVAWLTNPDESQRPESSKLEYHKFTQSEQHVKDVAKALRIHRGRIRTLARGLGESRRNHYSSSIALFSEMSNLETILDHLQKTNEKVVDLSSNDNIGRVMQKAVDLLQTIIVNGADPEKILVAATSLEEKCGHVNKELPLHHSVFDLFETLKKISLFVIEKEKIRTEMVVVREDNSVNSEIQEMQGKYQCKECGKVFGWKQSLKLHEKCHLGIDQAKPYKCDICDKRFERKFVLDDHRRTHLPDSEKISCDLCSKLFTSKGSLNKHKRSHLDSIEARKPFQCDLCGKRCSALNDLERHKLIHIPEEKKFGCDVCGVKYVAAYALERHKRSHIDENNPDQANDKRPFECEICGKRYTQAGTLTLHKKTHSDDEIARLPFACEKCELRFRRKLELENHQITHLSDDDPRKAKFQCSECGKRLANQFAFDCHKRTHLDETDPEQSKLKRPFKCEECNGSFTSANALKLHKNTHIDDNDPEQAAIKRPYPCDDCGKRFTQRSALRTHKNTHLGSEERKQFSCEVCSKTFIKKDNFNRHQLSHVKK